MVAPVGAVTAAPRYTFAMRLFNILGHLWALPNTLLALLFGIGGAYRLDRANRVIVVVGGWVAAIFGSHGYVGMCVGDVVICRAGDDLPIRAPRIYQHELVHATQSRLLGPFYLPLTLAGYLLGAVLYPRNPHDGSPLEVWADVASDNAATNRYLRDRRSRNQG